MKLGQITMGMRKAIDEKCKDCIYDPLAGGTWRQQTQACNSMGCPLWPYRPLTRGMRAEMNKQEYILMSQSEREKTDKRRQKSINALKQYRSTSKDTIAEDDPKNTD